MSAFGQAGFGSMNRRNQLRAQGQMDPYGQQVRAAKQAPTLNVYQTQGTQQATGQQQAPSQSQPAQQPAAAQPSLQLGAPAMPAYSQPAAPIAGSAQGGPGTAQPIQPQSQGTPYGQGPSTARPPALRTMSGMTGTIASEIAAQYHNAGLPVPQWLAQGVSAIKHKSLKSMYDARYVDPVMWKNASESERIQFLGKRGVDGKLIAGPDGNSIVDAWSPEKLAEMAQPTYGPSEDEQVRRNLASYRTPEALAARDRVGAAQPIQPQRMETPAAAQPRQATPGQAQPIQPQSQGTPYQSQPMVNDRPMRSIEGDMAADREFERQNGWWAQESARRGIDQSTGAPLAGRTNEQAAYADFVSRPQPIGPEPPQFNFDTSRLQAQQDQLMQQSNAAVYKALRRDSSQGNQSPMVSNANARLRRRLSQNMMLDTWRKKQQAGG